MTQVKAAALKPIRKSPCRRTPARGGAAVEFALVLPIFLAVLFATIDYGWYFYQRFTLAAAVRDGVRYGVTFPHCSAAGTPSCSGPTSDPWSKAQDRIKTDLQVPGSPINPSSLGWGPVTYSGFSPNEIMTLRASLPFVPLVGFVPLPASMSFQMSMLLEIEP